MSSLFSDRLLYAQKLVGVSLRWVCGERGAFGLFVGLFLSLSPQVSRVPGGLVFLLG